MLFFCCCFEPLKKEHIKNFNEFSLKKEEHLFWIFNFSFVWWATMLTNSPYELHGTYLSGSTLLLHQEGPTNSQSIVPLLSRGWNPLPGTCSDLDLKKFKMLFLMMSFSILIWAGISIFLYVQFHFAFLVRRRYKLIEIIYLFDLLSQTTQTIGGIFILCSIKTNIYLRKLEELAHYFFSVVYV